MRVWVTSLVAASVVGVTLARAQPPARSGPDPSAAAAHRFATTCAGCHGANLSGSAGPSLLSDNLLHGDDDQSLARSIRDGYPAGGMPAFGGALSGAETGELVAFLRERRVAAAGGLVTEAIAKMIGPQTASLPTGVVRTDVADFTVETVAQVGPAFGFAFLPGGKILITETGGALRVVDKGHLTPRAVQGTPVPGVLNDAFRRRLMDVSLHPDYRRNGWIYLTYAANVPPVPRETAVTVARGRINAGRWEDNQVLLTFRSELSSSARMAWDSQGYLYVGTSDSINFWEGPLDKAPPQILADPVGKILRLTDEGKVPPDNPFVDRPGAYPYIWTYGHRVPVGLAFDRKGELWETENGPRGGDEINHIRRGRNYGWPVITWGHRYDDRPVPAHTEAEGMEQPVANFEPSPALGGLAVYTGEAFPLWKDNLFAGSLKRGDLFRVVVDGDREVLRETVLHAIGRIRDINTGPDGLLYLLTDSGSLLRLRPAKPVPVQAREARARRTGEPVSP